MGRAKTIPPKILIIGAGVCGLTTAIRIAEGAVQQEFPARPRITILEAEPQAGGRVQTEELSNGIIVDTGAHWFHNGEKNPFYRWAAERYKLGPVSIDAATRRINATRKGALPPEQREWAMLRLFELYAAWKANHPGEDVSLADLAAESKSASIRMVAEERAINWMAVDGAKLVSSDEFFGDDSGSGGVQLEKGVAHLIDAMVEEVEYYGGDLQTRTAVKKIIVKAKGGVSAVDMQDNVYNADIAIVTVPAAVLKSGAIVFDEQVQKRLNPVLKGLTVAKMAKIFIPLRREFFEKKKIAPDTFVTFYDQKHSWLCHLRTDGNPVVTVFACGAMADLVENANPGDMEEQVFRLLEQISVLKGCSKALDGRIRITEWTTNANFLGAYSAMLPGAKRVNPLDCGSIIFAGEAFVADPRKSPAQMTGAWTSGCMAAAKVLRKISKAATQ